MSRPCGERVEIALRADPGRGDLGLHVADDQVGDADVVAQHVPDRLVRRPAIDDLDRLELQPLGVGVDRVDDAAASGVGAPMSRWCAVVTEKPTRSLPSNTGTNATTAWRLPRRSPAASRCSAAAASCSALSPSGSPALCCCSRRLSASSLPGLRCAPPAGCCARPFRQATSSPSSRRALVGRRSLRLDLLHRRQRRRVPHRVCLERRWLDRLRRLAMQLIVAVIVALAGSGEVFDRRKQRLK